MENSFGHHSDQDLIAVLDGVLDALTDDRLRLESPQQRLGLAVAAVRVASRVSVWVQQVLAGVEIDEVAVQVHGTSTTTWLADAARLTPREARRLIRAGEGLARFGLVGEAARTGEVSVAQAEAITSVLAELPDDFDTDQIIEGESTMIGFAHTHNSAELRRLTHHLVEVLSPETVEAREAGRLEREARLAHARRFLTLTADGHGSVLIRGSLPVVDAEPFRKLIDSYTTQIRRGLEAADPLQPTPSASQRRADALCRLVERHQHQALAPCLGGDRPRLVVTLSLRQAAQAGPRRRHGARPEQYRRSGSCGNRRRKRWWCTGHDRHRAGHRTQRATAAAVRRRHPAHRARRSLRGPRRRPTTTPRHRADPGSPQSDGTSEIRPPRRVDPHQKPRIHARFLTRRRN